jgi:hypothetical protein
VSFNGCLDVTHKIFVFLPFAVMVYRYYYFNRLKQRYPHMSFWGLMHWTWRWSFLGPPPEPTKTSESGKSSSGTSKVKSLMFSSQGAREQSRPEEGDDNGNQRDTGSESDVDEKDLSSFRTDGSATIERHDHPNIPVDDVMDQQQTENKYLMDFLRADLLMSYGDFPNTLSEETVMFTADFPTMIGPDSYSCMSTPGPLTDYRNDLLPPTDGNAMSYPTIIKDDVYD